MAHDTDALNKRLERLEELVAHQAVTLEEMSGELLRLHEAHSDLTRRHKALVGRLEEFEDTSTGSDAPRYEKPPHY